MSKNDRNRFVEPLEITRDFHASWRLSKRCRRNNIIMKKFIQ